MTNRQICDIFAKSNVEGKVLSMHIDGDRLFSYGTCIAQKIGNNEVIFNVTKYSNTTSHHQSYARQALAHWGYTIRETTSHVKMGTRDLHPFIDKK